MKRSLFARNLKRARHSAVLALLLAGALTIGACADPEPSSPTGLSSVPDSDPGPPRSIQLPSEDGAWIPEVTREGRLPSGSGTIEIIGKGEFTFKASQVVTVRPDIFQPGRFSVFDVLVHLAERGDIELAYHFDETLGTHVIDSLQGQPYWWYEVKYSGGWFETNVFRMDMYPYKDNTDVVFFQETPESVARILQTFGAEVERLGVNNGRVVVPRVAIEGPKTNAVFENVVVTAHNVRSDILQPGVVTALDVLLSLGEQGRLSAIDLTWYDSIAGADPVDSYWVERIGEDKASGGCGFVYETGPEEFSGFRGSHIHIPLDVRVIVSPDYALWFWICL